MLPRVPLNSTEDPFGGKTRAGTVAESRWYLFSTTDNRTLLFLLKINEEHVINNCLENPTAAVFKLLNNLWN